MSTIEVKHVSVHYDGIVALEDISFKVSQGKIIGLIGPNGAGKSTLMKVLLGLVKYSGEVSILGKPVDKQRKEIAYVPQRSAIDWDFPVRVIDVVKMGRFVHIPWYKRLGKTDKDRAMEALHQVGMEEFANRQIGELSGGQQQRVFIARAIAQDAETFFLDEPFVGIDVTSEEIIVNLLRDLKHQGKTIVVIHHDLSKVESYFDELLLLNRKLIGSGEVEDVFSEENLKAAYVGNMAVVHGKSDVMVVNP
ncbi:metal ABC transporter ATP-binding protein [Paenalkalicoccus suaedae]|uniref:Metal ABC transporter ATP-binding protein n=1 Tax=Paenalkalicoccus suaedae TaxID=2592382 RepID=A0A859FC03_9BACI|nr:metal ABC transporter ATP-binding protein [Paenalkalicoccus suaedae]QKS70883.1 metal ABC transporter ATP-binding protein [Paenalkalicoccus suaedae]